MKFVIENKDGTLTYPVSRAKIDSIFTHVSFPNPMEDYVNEELGIYPFVESDPPESIHTHKNVEADPIKIENKYVQQWDTPHPRPQQELDEILNEKLKRVKEHAHLLILSKYPFWKQTNLFRRHQVLKEKETLSVSEEQELLDIQEAWDWIDSVRTASNTLEDYLKILDIPSTIEFNVSSYENWPAE